MCLIMPFTSLSLGVVFNSLGVCKYTFIWVCVCVCDQRFAEGLDELQWGLWVLGEDQGASGFSALVSLMLQPSEFHCSVPKWNSPPHLIPGYCQAYRSLSLRGSSHTVELTKGTILYIFLQQFHFAVEAFWVIHSDLELILLHLEYLHVGIWEI